MSQALYRKWRPTSFADVVGQEHVVQTLRNALAAERVGHAYLFCGPRGTGKTTLARLLAKAVNCKRRPDICTDPADSCSICNAIVDGRFLDLIEIDAASNTSVDDVRDLRDKINFAPAEGRFKVYIIDEVHMLSTAAFNALLKTLEEPPPHAIFVLATTEEHKVPLTIKSRCQQFNFRLLTLNEITERLFWVAGQEGLTIEPAALQLVAREAAGSVRDGLSLLDQLITVPGDTISLDRARQVLGAAAAAVVADLVEAWLAGRSADGLAVIHQALDSGTDARQFARQMVMHLRHILLLQTGGAELAVDVPDEQRPTLISQAQRADRRALIEMIKLFNEAAHATTSGWQPQLPLELAFIESLPDGLAQVAPLPAYQPASAPPATVAAPSKTVAAPPKTVAAPSPAPAATQATPEAAATAAEPPAPAPTSPAAADHAVDDDDGADAEPRPAVAGPLTLDDVKAQWQPLMRQARQHDRSLPALLTAAKPLGVEEHVIVFGFDYPILKEKFDKKPESAHVVADILSRLLGQTCRLRTVLTADYTPAQAVSRGDVEALARELGGTVSEISG